MATLLEVLGDRAAMDELLREQAGREYDAMTPEQQRATYIHQVRVIQEITYTLQLAHSDQQLLSRITDLAWSTNGSPAA